jgi:hypothetical protein
VLQVFKWIMWIHLRHLCFKKFPMVYETLQSNEFWPLKLLFKYLQVSWISTSQSGNPLGNVWVHSFTLPHTFVGVNMISKLHSWPSLFHVPCLGCKPKARVVTFLVVHNHIHLSFFMFSTKIKNSQICGAKMQCKNKI